MPLLLLGAEGDEGHGEVAHLEGGREHGALQRAALGDALVEVERLRACLLAEEGGDACLRVGEGR